ncbi:MAG TPA: hypothetical protein VLV16_10480 [Gemmatimonadales bacterium]|nr:hypothetical protein [Gemmatimonadales bacterium]
MAAQPQADPAFDRDLFLLRQQVLRISEKYDVADEQGNKIVFVERPAHLLRNLGAALAGIVAACMIGGVFAGLAALFTQSALGVLFASLAVIGFLVGLFVVGVGLSAKRHVTFYRDASKGQKLLEVLQDRKWQLITATYTVRDPSGRTLALLWKNYMYNLFRKRWYVKDASGKVQYVAKEDSVILSLLRRLLGPLFGFLRTNFIIARNGTEEVVGEFNRKFTILDRYVLDLRSDIKRSLDRRVALALGVMLDTGERR